MSAPGLQLKHPKSHHQSYFSNSFTERCEWISDFFWQTNKTISAVGIETDNYTFQHYVKV